jgi:hypothetical protein
MTLAQLVAKLIDYEIEHGNEGVTLEVGGDGTIHSSQDIYLDLRDDQVVITSEAP